MIDLSINTQRVRQVLTDFIHSQTTQAGFSRAVIGLSGGIDSTLSCFLAAEALGAPNVLAVCLPYKTSSPDSLEDARLVIEATGVQSLKVEITELADPLIAKFQEMSAIRRGNIMARCRMTVLYDQSAAFNGLVVGTGNKTEILLGYTTLYGDSACAYNPIGDLFKTQVRQLSRELGVPPTILNKAPSADLWKGQTDEGELGFMYAEVDQLLYLLVEKGYGSAECQKAGFSESFVKRVVERVKRNQYKRALPPIAWLSNRSVGYDFLSSPEWGT